MDPGGSIAVLAEKPSVARDIARVLGAGKRGEGYLHGNGYVVTWAIGHLVALAQPHEIHPEWRRGGATCCPCCRAQWPLVVSEKTKDQFEVVRSILNSPQGRARRVRHRRRARGRADLPLHLRGRRLQQAGQPAVDLVAHRRTPSARASTSCAPAATTTPWPTPPAAAAAPTGWWA